jgi:hypothetical protein
MNNYNKEIIEKRKKQIWSEYNITNHKYFDFILHFIDYFSERWCENFYDYIQYKNKNYLSFEKFVKFTKKLNTIIKFKHVNF